MTHDTISHGNDHIIDIKNDDFCNTNNHDSNETYSNHRDQNNTIMNESVMQKHQ